MKQADPTGYFKSLDDGTKRALAALERGEGSCDDRRAITWDVVQSSILQMNLLEDIVLPTLRRGGIQPSLLDQAEADARVIMSIAEEVVRAGHDPSHSRIRDLTVRFRRRVKLDELELWPAARSSNADLDEIANWLDWAWDEGLSQRDDE